MKKMISLFLALTMLAAGLAGCTPTQAGSPSSQPEAQDALFTPGTYVGESTGFGGPMKVEVEVDANAILSVTVKEHGESAGISDPAFAKIPAAIVENQSIGIDAVSGCTMSSKGILDGASAALSQTCKDMSKISTAVVQGPASTELLAKSADVVIIGAGGAGMSAAVEAVKAGSSVLVLEKMPAMGGNTILAGSALNSADPERQKNQTMTTEELAKVEELLTLEPKGDRMKEWQATLKDEIAQYKAAGSKYLFDSPTLHKLQTYVGGDYVGDPALIDVFCDNALDAVNFLGDLGVEWDPNVTIAMGATWKRSHTPNTKFGVQGASFLLPQAEFIKTKGSEIMLDAKAEELVMTDGRCTGVKGHTTAGQPFEITANKGVIIATGGFSASVEMREQYNKHWPTLDANVGTTNHPGATGDGIAMADKVGANLVGMEWIQLVPYGSKGIPTAAIDNLFYINKEGKRFVREDARRDELSKAVLSQPDAQMFLIYDGHTVIDGVAIGGGTKVDELVGKGSVWKADTLEELATQIGVPYENLKATVDQFNQSVANGNDPLGRTIFGTPVDQGPFYATQSTANVHHTMGGIAISVNAEVLDKSGNPIPGLFAAGETTGGIHGANRLGGNAIADIMVFGRIAGQNASK